MYSLTCLDYGYSCQNLHLNSEAEQKKILKYFSSTLKTVVIIFVDIFVQTFEEEEDLEIADDNDDAEDVEEKGNMTQCHPALM